MKKIVTITLFIFWTAVTAILTAGLVFYNRQQTVVPQNRGQPSSSAAASAIAAAGGSITLNMAEIARHNNASDCWMVISGKIYDVTSAISIHPGGAATILASCGSDATQAFTTKDQQSGRNHSSFAYNLLSNYYLGNLNQTLTSQQLNSSQTSANNNPQDSSNALGGREDEND